MKKTLVVIASLVGITSYTLITNNVAPVNQQATLQFSKTYQHDSGYNVIGDPVNVVKPVDSGLGVKHAPLIKPDNSSILAQLIQNFEYAQYRDVPVSKLPEHLRIKISPLMYL